MSDHRDQLERERRKHAMRDGTLEGLQRRRDRKHRNAQILAGIVALLIAAAGIGGGLFALRGAEKVPPAHNPTPSPRTVPSPRSAAPSRPSGPIQFVDAEHGWVVDGKGQILATSDGGRTWHVQLSGPANIKAVEFLDLQHGWGVGDSGLIHTSDGGEHWVTWGNEPLLSIQFKDESVGWGIRRDSRSQEGGPAGSVVRSMDGGKTWAPQGLAADALCYSRDENTDNLWTAGPGKGGISLMRSTDDGASWTEQTISVPEGEPWSASLQCFGNEVWVQLTDGGAAGHTPYGVFQSIDGAQARLVMQEAGTRPFGHQEEVYESDDPYPGPFTVADAGAAYFLNWCPACVGGPQASVSITVTAGEPAVVTHRFPVVTGALPAQPLGVSFVAPEDGSAPTHGWALVEMNDSHGPARVLLETRNGGKTWGPACDTPRPGPCFRPQP
jgi:photosystem II stability/assembly factor-like uncharacterized protein